MDKENKRFDLNIIRQNFIYEKIELIVGQTLFEEGQSNDYVFFIENGAIKVLKNKWEIGITYSKEFVGITSCLNDSKFYNFTSKAITSSIVWKIKKIDFKNLLGSNKEFSKQIIEILCERIKLTDLKTKNYINYNTKQRLLLFLNEKKNISNIDIQIDLNDLSEQIGTTNRSLKKILKDLKIQNIISFSNQNIINILDFNKLEQILLKK